MHHGRAEIDDLDDREPSAASSRRGRGRSCCATGRAPGRAVEDAAQRAGTTRGARIARGLLASAATPSLTDTEIEEFFLAEVRPALKPPECQRWITLDDGGPAIRADFLWPAERLVVETDGGVAHMTRRAFEEDRRRDQRLAAAGYTVVRFTWRQLSDDPDNVRRVVRELLARLAPQ